MLSAIARTTAWAGAIAWFCTLLMVAATVAVVAERYLFSESTIWLQESVTYLHSLAFMLGLAYALRHDAHVRVDLLYARFPPKRRAVVDLVGHLVFLLPLCALIVLTSEPYVSAAWRVLEGSPEVGGIPAVFLLKSLMPLAAVTLALEAIARCLDCLGTLRQAQST